MKVLEVMMPQFDRTPDDPPPACPPSSREDWDALTHMSAAALRELGLRPWSKQESTDSDSDIVTDRTLWLFPAAWYAHIPDGFWIVNIFWRTDVFRPGVTDADTRFGCLAYGILGPDA